MKKCLQLFKYIRFNDLFYALSVLGVSIFAYFIHFLYQKVIQDNINIYITIGGMIINGFVIGRIGSLIGQLDKNPPVWYKYLPNRYRRYQGLLDINGWIPVSMLFVIFFTYRGWLDSIMVIMIYWVVDFLIRQIQIKKVIQAAKEEDGNQFFRNHKGIFVELGDLEYLLKYGYNDIDSRADVMKLFGELFLLYWKEKVGKDADRCQNDFDLAYENVYKITYQCLEDICDKTYNFIDFNRFLMDFLETIETLVKEKETYDKYVFKTVSAAAIAFASFKENKLDRTRVYQVLEEKKTLKNQEIIGIWLWCIEFQYQYNERRDSIRITLKPETVRLYTNHIDFQDERNVNFYRFLWFVWTKQAEKSLSESIVNIEELIEYCKRKKRKTDSTGEKRGIKTTSLYILMKEIQLEQGMIL